jgi:crotonobetaine/carnitine-CoA ligase
LHKRKLGTCGFQHPDYDVFLQADDGSEAGVDEPGELLIRPKKFNGMMLEYYRMPEKTVEAWSNLWFHTGDYLKRDADGWFYFVDRKKDALRRRGENISSYEVEREINAHPAVLESAAIAVKSELGEDELMVVVCRKPGATLDAEALIAHCQEKMAYFMVPRYLRFVDAMPKTPTERIQKFKLRSEGVTADTFDREAGTQR